MKKYFSVKCTNKDEAKKVLKLFEKEGCLWNDGSKPLKYLSWFNKNSPTYLNHEDKKLTFSNFLGLYDVIDANDYIKKKTKKSKSIEKNVIVITKINNKEVIAVNLANNEKATAKCHPDDEFDFNTGARIALNRLLEGLTTKKEKPIKAGEKVKFKDKENVYSYAENWKEIWENNSWVLKYAWSAPYVLGFEDIHECVVVRVANHWTLNKLIALVKVTYKGSDIPSYYLTDLDNLERA